MNLFDAGPGPPAGISRPLRRASLARLASPGELELLRAALCDIEISPCVRRWIDLYRQVGKRDELIWKWCLEGFRLTTLPSVSSHLRQHLGETKLIHIVWNLLVDDIADHAQDNQLLLAVEEMMNGSGLRKAGLVAESDHRSLELIEICWQEIWKRARSYPRFTQFKEFLRYDYLQVFNAMQYTLLVNSCPAALNMVEHDVYQPHGMTVMVLATLDLCCSPDFDIAELGKAREVFWHAQCMGRIGNMITGWEREARVRDFSSGVFAQALSDGLLTAEQLRELDPQRIIEVIVNERYEARFLEIWSCHREKICERIKHIRSLNLGPYVSGFESLLKLDLAVRGMK